MARTEARLRTKLWGDPDFLALSFRAKGGYESILCQPDVEYTGVMPLRARRLALLFGLDLEDLIEILEELEDARFIVIDWDTEELLIRTFIRNDEVYRQPNVMRSALKSLASVSSLRLRAEILTELRRIEAEEEMPKGSREPFQAMIAALEKDPAIPSQSPEPSTEQPKPEPKPEGFAEPLLEPFGEGMTGEGGASGSGEGVGVGDVGSRSVVTYSRSTRVDHGSDDDPEFVRWWDRYPRKVAKGRARTAWRKAIKKASPDDLVEALENYGDHWRAAETKLEYIPHPATWLNGECWNDEFGSPGQHREQRGVDIWALSIRCGRSSSPNSKWSRRSAPGSPPAAPPTRTGLRHCRWATGRSSPSC